MPAGPVEAQPSHIGLVDTTTPLKVGEFRAVPPDSGILPTDIHMGPPVAMETRAPSPLSEKLLNAYLPLREQAAAELAQSGLPTDAQAEVLAFIDGLAAGDPGSIAQLKAAIKQATEGRGVVPKDALSAMQNQMTKILEETGVSEKEMDVALAVFGATWGVQGLLLGAYVYLDRKGIHPRAKNAVGTAAGALGIAVGMGGGLAACSAVNSPEASIVVEASPLTLDEAQTAFAPYRGGSIAQSISQEENIDIAPTAPTFERVPGTTNLYTASGISSKGEVDASVQYGLGFTSTVKGKTLPFLVRREAGSSAIEPILLDPAKTTDSHMEYVIFEDRPTDNTSDFYPTQNRVIIDIPKDSEGNLVPSEATMYLLIDGVQINLVDTTAGQRPSPEPTDEPPSFLDKLIARLTGATPALAAEAQEEFAAVTPVAEDAGTQPGEVQPGEGEEAVDELTVESLRALAPDASPLVMESLPVFVQDAMTNWEKASDKDRELVQAYIESVRADFFEKEEIADAVANMTGITEKLRSNIGMGYWMRMNTERVIAENLTIVVTPSEMVWILQEPVFNRQEESSGNFILQYGVDDFAADTANLYPGFPYSSDVVGPIMGFDNVNVGRAPISTVYGEVLMISPMAGDSSAYFMELILKNQSQDGKTTQYSLWGGVVRTQGIELHGGDVVFASHERIDGPGWTATAPVKLPDGTTIPVRRTSLVGAGEELDLRELLALLGKNIEVKGTALTDDVNLPDGTLLHLGYVLDLSNLEFIKLIQPFSGYINSSNGPWNSSEEEDSGQ